MKEDVYGEKFPVSSTVGIPQPWETEQKTQEAYMAQAEQSGRRLVVETWVNGYADPKGEGDSWIVDSIHYSDSLTGEYIYGYDPNETEPDERADGLIVVERRLAE